MKTEVDSYSLQNTRKIVKELFFKVVVNRNF